MMFDNEHKELYLDAVHVYDNSNY